MNDDKINKLRKEIDDIDNQLLRLIMSRSLIVEKIGTSKDITKNVEDKNRESQVINRLIDLHQGNFPKDSLIRLWREIFSASIKVQLNIKNDLIPKKGIDSIKAYKGGVSRISGIENIIKLSSNESPFGPSPNAIEAYKKSSLKLSRYPELKAETLQLEIAKKFNLNSKQIICGTGSDEVLIFSALAFFSEETVTFTASTAERLLK